MVLTRLDGRVHNKVKGVSHLAFWTRRRRRRGGEQRNGLEQKKQGGAVHGFHIGVSLVQQPRALASRQGGEQLGEEEAGGSAR
jgi:hypothetical protein